MGQGAQRRLTASVKGDIAYRLPFRGAERRSFRQKQSPPDMVYRGEPYDAPAWQARIVGEKAPPGTGPNGAMVRTVVGATVRFLIRLAGRFFKVGENPKKPRHCETSRGFVRFTNGDFNVSTRRGARLSGPRPSPSTTKG
jgi:hypothetical protein